MIRHMDKTIVSNPAFTRFALSAAKNQGIGVQEAVRSGGGTNGGAIQLSGDGVPVIVVSMAVRHAHAPCGISSGEDFEATVALIKGILRSIKEETIAGF